jgi:hypothetical protein
MTRAVARLGRLDAVLAPEKPGFDYGPVHVRYVVGKLASGQFLLGVFQISQLVSLHPRSIVIKEEFRADFKTTFQLQRFLTLPVH